MTRTFYSLTFKGAAGSGVGILVFDQGDVMGVDIGGVRYDGKYRVEGGQLQADLTVTVPPGATLVTGVPAQAREYSFPVPITIPLDDVELPIRVPTPIGPVAAVLRKLR